MLPLHTERLTLRRFAEADAPVFLAYRNDPEVARFQSWDYWSPDEALQFIRRQQLQAPGVPGEWLQIAIAIEESHTLIGDCAFRVEGANARQATIGITLARTHQGRGFATEALQCLLEYLFDVMRLHRVVADTDPRNRSSWRLLERLGLRREGYLRQSLWFKGAWVDEYLYALLREEWLAQQSTAPER